MEYEKSKIVQWFCGFYEGEGYVCNDKSNNNRLRLGIAQNDKTPLEIALTIWGGSISKRIRKSPLSDKMCEGHEWRLCHKEALEFIKDIRPFMIIPYKKQQIENALHLAEKGIKRRFKCKHCHMDYASPAGRRRHVKAIHLNSDASGSNELQDNQTAGNP
jgi:hypothetical protein